MQQAADEFRLLSDDCRPTIRNDGVRYAVASDQTDGFLVVLQHSPPYRAQAVCVTALVVTSPSSLSRLVRWLVAFASANARWMRGLHIGGPHTPVIHLSNGLTVTDVSRALCGTNFHHAGTA